MKTLVTVFLCVALSAPSSANAAGMTAEQILVKVSQTYRGLRSFRFVERFESTEPTSGPIPLEDWSHAFGTRPTSYETDLAVAAPGKIRLVVKSREGKILLVSNGRETWAYIPSLNEYIQAAAAPLLQELWERPTDPISSVARFGDLAGEAKRAKLRGEDTLSLGGQKIRCYVVDFSAGQRLWVDEQYFTVLRHTWSVSGIVGGVKKNWIADVPSATWTSSLEEPGPGPISGQVFEFAVPRSARRVASFSAPARSVQREEEQLADPD